MPARESARESAGLSSDLEDILSQTYEASLPMIPESEAETCAVQRPLVAPKPPKAPRQTREMMLPREQYGISLRTEQTPPRESATDSYEPIGLSPDTEETLLLPTFPTSLSGINETGTSTVQMRGKAPRQRKVVTFRDTYEPVE